MQRNSTKFQTSFKEAKEIHTAFQIPLSEYSKFRKDKYDLLYRQERPEHSVSAYTPYQVYIPLNAFAIVKESVESAYGSSTHKALMFSWYVTLLLFRAKGKRILHSELKAMWGYQSQKTKEINYLLKLMQEIGLTEKDGHGSSRAKPVDFNTSHYFKIESGYIMCIPFYIKQGLASCAVNVS